MKSFRETLEEVVKVWQEENPCEDGHDHVTPFDRFFYGNYTLEAPSAPVEVEDFDEWYASYDGVGGPKNPEQLARDAWERAAALAAQLGGSQ